MLEPRAAVRPAEARRRRRAATASDWMLDGAKALRRRAPRECELFVIAAEAEGIGPALFLVESGIERPVSHGAEPAMGLRAAATGRLCSRACGVAGHALLGGGPARGLRRVRAPRADRLVRARASAPRRRCSTT